MTDGLPNHAYKVGHAAGRAAGIRAAMAAISNLPTGKSEDVEEGQEQAYRAIEDLLLSLADGLPAPMTLAAALALPEVKALVEALKMAQVWLNFDGRFDMQTINAALRRIAEGGE